MEIGVRVGNGIPVAKVVRVIAGTCGVEVLFGLGEQAECRACHMDEYRGAKTPDHAAGGFSTECQTCHTATTWSHARFDHQRSGFPLTGAHRSTACESCHAGGRYAGTPKDCFSCHQADYDRAQPPHASSGFASAACASCHTTTNWSGASFNHAATSFPLTGAHRSATCMSCHSDGVYDGKPTNCESCHMGTYDAARPDHRAAGPPTGIIPPSHTRKIDASLLAFHCFHLRHDHARRGAGRRTPDRQCVWHQQHRQGEHHRADPDLSHGRIFHWRQMGGRESQSRGHVRRFGVGCVLPWACPIHRRTGSQVRGDRYSRCCRSASWAPRSSRCWVLFSVPITLLGTISPFAIRVSVDDPAHAGEISGRIYATSTLGSFIGTFLPTLVFIPAIGTTKTFLLFSLVLLFVALAGLGLYSSRGEMFKLIWMPAILALIAILWSGQALKHSAGQIYETESAYNYIQVAEQNGFTVL